MITKMIKIYILEGCDKCKKLKSTLDKLNIKYNCITCEESPNACDQIESITGVDMYPIVDLGKTFYILLRNTMTSVKRKRSMGTTH